MSRSDSSQQLTRTDPQEEDATCLRHPVLLHTPTPLLYTRIPTVANCERVTACIRSGRTYVLTNVKAQNSCLDLSGVDRYSILGFQHHGGPNQTWIFERQHNGNYLIKSTGYNIYLSIEGEPRDRTRVVGEPTRFEWYVENQPGIQQAIRLFVPGTNQNVGFADDGNPSAYVTLSEKQMDDQHQLWCVESIGGTR